MALAWLFFFGSPTALVLAFVRVPSFGCSSAGGTPLLPLLALLRAPLTRIARRLTFTVDIPVFAEANVLSDALSHT